MDYLLKRSKGNVVKTLASLFCLYLASSSTFILAQQEPGESIQPAEEIIVNPTESFPILRRQIIEAERNLFSIYNDFNDDDDFDVLCMYENRPGSRMREHVCRPAYFWIARNGESMRMYSSVAGMFDPTLGGGSGYNPNISADPGQAAGRGLGKGVEVLGGYNRKMEDKIKAVIEKSPEFVEAVGEYNTLSEEYRIIREERFGE